MTQALAQGGNLALGTSSVDISVQAGGPVDVAALLLTGEGRVRSDADFIFYNQPQGPGVEHRGGGIHAELTSIPVGIERIAVVASLDGSGPRDFGALGGATVTVAGGDGPIATFTPGALTSETAVVLVDVYLRNGQWKVRAVGQGWASGLAGIATSFGVDVGDPGQSAPPDPAPPPQQVAPAPQVAPPPVAPPQPAPAAGPRHCTQCGSEIPGGARFCTSCGAPTAVPSATAEPPAPPAAPPQPPPSSSSGPQRPEPHPSWGSGPPSLDSQPHPPPPTWSPQQGAPAGPPPSYPPPANAGPPPANPPPTNLAPPPTSGAPSGPPARTSAPASSGQVRTLAPPEPPLAPVTPAAAAPPAPKVQLGKVTLEKKGATRKVSLTKATGGGAGGVQALHFNLNWHMAETHRSRFGKPAKATDADLDLGCMVELKDGMKMVIQPLGNKFGSRDDRPYVYLDKDDRSGDSADGENLYVLRPDLITRVLVFGMIYEGAPDFISVGGTLTITDQDGNQTIIPLNNPEPSLTWCAICLVTNDGGDTVEISKQERYYHRASEADKDYKFGFTWHTARKE